MKKSFITALIVLISVALIGLVAIQIYWIRNSIELRDAQFRYNVKVALTEFNHILEKEEAAIRMRKHNLGKRLLSSIDSLRSARPLASVTVNLEGLDDVDPGQRQPAFKLESKSQTRQLDLGEQNTADGVRDPLDALQGESAYRTFSPSETEIITEIISNWLPPDSVPPFTERYTHSMLDSLLNSCLAEVGGITTGYLFGIFDVFDQPVIFSRTQQNQMVSLVEYGYRSRLFPNDANHDVNYIRVWFPKQDTYLIKTLWPLLFSSAVFMLTVILAFGYTIHTILQQKKVSEIKNDFINNMTHELKTPISTISLACEALSDPVMSSSQTKVSHFVKMIRDENKRLGVLVENVLRSAVLDRGQMKLNRERVELHSIIDTAIHNIALQATQRAGQIRTDLQAVNPIIKCDKVHLTNVVYNLLDNAIKYSTDAPDIKVCTKNSDSGVLISVTDKGIGIRKDDQERIFEKLFRVHTGDVHNIKGFGLGLSYVKMIVEKHHGTISVKSESGKGSTFTIHLPYDYEL